VKLPFKLPEVGLIGPRRAVALAVLGWWTSIYTLVAINIDGAWVRPFIGLAACYGLAFFAVAAGWFWGRWFASGLGWSGVMIAIFAIVMSGWHPALAWYGGLHGLIVLALLGKEMATEYDARSNWRERYQMGEPAAQRLGRAVTRAGASLPSLILWALAPREEGMAIVVLGVAIAGIAALLRNRAWGALAIGAAGIFALVAGGVVMPMGQGFYWDTLYTPYTLAMARAVPAVAIPGLLLFAFLPFAAPTFRFLFAKRETES
jgi:hypothetical protein